MKRLRKMGTRSSRGINTWDNYFGMNTDSLFKTSAHRVDTGQERRRLESAMACARTAPCNGCCHEEYCKKGFCCEQYEKWVKLKVNEVGKVDLSIYSRVPDRPI